MRQFVAASAVPSPEDVQLARGMLTEPLRDLFFSQHPRDVMHGVATARWLLKRGHTDPDLLLAGLLHDVGKGDQRRRDRVAHVLVEGARVGPHVAAGASRWRVRRALARSAAHAESGAVLLDEAGASPRVVELTRLHHSRAAGDGMLDALQQADDAC